jgi:hypothetical protein
MNNIRSFLTAGVQILSALAAVNITVIGFTVSSQKASIFLLGVILMLIALVLHRSTRKYMIPYIYSAILVEQSLFNNDADPTWTFASLFLGDQDFREKVESIVRCNSLDKRREMLVKVATPRLLPDHLGTYAFIWLGMIGQLLLIPTLVLAGWDFI